MLRLFAALFCVFALSGRARADDALLVSRGKKLLDMQGCTACHSLNGDISAGPTFLGRFGHTSEVRTNGALRSVPYDADYVRRSVQQPEADVVKGFAPGVMPRFTLDDEQLTAITAALTELGKAEANEPAKEPPPLTWLALFSLLFVGGHLALSGERVRPWLVGRLGERGFWGVYALIVASALTGMIWTYSDAPYLGLWHAGTALRVLGLIVMAFAVFLFVAGLTTRTPTQVGQAGALAEGEPARGVLRITRHPQLCAYLLWSAAHLCVNGDAASLLFFGAFGALALLGALHIEQRRAHRHGEAWARFAAVTSFVPFQAIFEGRNRLVFAEIGALRVLVALALYAALLFAHRALFGASPFP